MAIAPRPNPPAPFPDSHRFAHWEGGGVTANRTIDSKSELAVNDSAFVPSPALLEKEGCVESASEFLQSGTAPAHAPPSPESSGVAGEDGTSDTSSGGWRGEGALPPPSRRREASELGKGAGGLGPPLLQAQNLTKTYVRGSETVHALDNVTFTLHEGEFAAIVGPSGAGKTTLLHLLGGMDGATSGILTLSGQPIHNLSDRALTRLRRDHIGFVFQHFGLLPTLTVRENVCLPALFARRSGRQKADELLARVGLSHRADHRPHELSGGEMQRVAIARALINGPRLLLADEPTGNLDTASGESILHLFQELNRDGLTLIVVTHNEWLAQAAHRRLTLRDGQLVEDTFSSAT